MSDYQQARREFYRLRCEATAAALVDKGFEAITAADREDAAQRIMDMIDPDETVGIPGTVTVRELGLMQSLQERGNPVVQHWVTDAEPAEIRELRLKQLTSDVLLTGTNAVTLDGRLVNIDGTGNRVAAMVFGPDRVIVVTGANKIVDDLQEGVDRVKRIAAPINAIRLDTRSPCARTGYCVDCEAGETICGVTVVMDRKPGGTDVTVVLVPEELGY